MTAFATQLLTLFGIGLLGSGHCLAMCGGIASAFSLRASTQGGSAVAAAGLVPLYSVGRIGSYALLGAVAGALGAVAVEIVPQLLATLRIVAGGLLVLMGIYLAGLWNGLQSLERLGSALFRIVRPLQTHAHGALEPLVLGMVWGLLPCGLVYSALAYSITAADPLQAALLMAAFGLGTLPAVLGGGLMAVPLARTLRLPGVRRIAGAVVVGLGIWTLAHAHAGHSTQGAPGAVHPHHAEHGAMQHDAMPHAGAVP
jgi:sulfite exporter TauE/SafE